MNMRALLLHVAVTATCVVAVSVASLGRSPNPTVLEVFALSSFDAPECGLGAPKTVLIYVAADGDIWLGNEASEPTRFRDDPTILAELRRLKDERLDREAVVIEVKDGVAFSTVSRLVDMLHGVEMRFVSIITGGSGSQFDPNQWSRPSYRDSIPVPPRAY